VKSPLALDQEFSELPIEIGKAAGFSEDEVGLSPLLGDGSERRFFRLRQGSSHFVALISPRRKHSGIDENDSYFLIGTHLYRQNVPVPRIYWADLNRGCFLLEDLGDFHLQAYVNRRRMHLFPIYRRVVGLLSDMQRRAREGFETGYCFDSVQYDPVFVYQRELEYFRERFLNGYLGLEIGPDDLRRDFENIAEAACDTTFSHVIHRDFQSRNIMIYAHRLRLVDFQGMRFGPPAYDLASLLIDPYVRIPRKMEMKVIALYWSKACDFLGGSFGRFMQSYGIVRLCRNLQVLGAYSYLGLARCKRHFLRYIPPAWGQLYFWVNHHGHRFPTLLRLVNQIHHTPGPASRLPALPRSFS
jgi:aminoglycoside/choline kinase family phosphotransferase